MPIQKILVYPNPFLNQKTQPVDHIENVDIQTLIDDMIETMLEYGGVGLAANQIGIDKSIIVYDQTEGKTDTRVLINPEITEKSTSMQKSKEGCLCIPGLFIPINRYTKIKVKGYTREGIKIDLEAETQLANILQHEIDHLNGILFVDRLSKIQRQVFRKRLRRIKKF